MTVDPQNHHPPGLSGTAALLREAERLRRAGIDVLNLGAGDPDMGPPPRVLEAVRRALDGGRIPYTEPEGLPELREAVAAVEARRGGLALGPEHVVVTTGGKQALALLTQALLEPGAAALIPSPHWPSFPAMVHLAGGTPVTVPCARGDGFHPGVEAVAGAWTSRTGLVILCSPNNPTGAVLSQAEMDLLVDTALSRGGAVISDETYAAIVFDGRRAGTALPWVTRAPGRVAVVGSASKSWSMTGFRVGWAVAAGGLPSWLAGLVSHHTSCPPTLAQHAALAALQGPPEELEARAAEYQARRDLLLDTLRGCPALKVTPPEGALYVFPRLATDAGAVAERLLVEERVAVVPGNVFGEPRALRLALTAPRSLLAEAGRRIRRVLG